MTSGGGKGNNRKTVVITHHELTPELSTSESMQPYLAATTQFVACMRLQQDQSRLINWHIQMSTGEPTAVSPTAGDSEIFMRSPCEAQVPADRKLA
jgi:hypothetical protein